MKLTLTAFAATLALASLVPDEAAAQGRGYRAASGKQVYRVHRRPASVQPNGLCQRDTGTPTGQLNFRNRCDTEEYWNRVIGGHGRR